MRQPISRTLAILATLLACLLSLPAGCRKRPAPQGSEQASAPAAARRAPEAAAVTVNGTDLTNRQIDASTDEIFEHYYAGNPQGLSERVLRQRRVEIRRQVLEQAVVEQLLDEQVARLGITVGPNDLDAKLTRDFGRPMTVTQFAEQLRSQGQDPNTVLPELERATRYEILFDRVLGTPQEVNEADIEAYYRQHLRDEFTEPERRHCRHILVDPKQINPNEAPDVARQQARQRAEALLVQLRQGADFAALAREHSNGPSGPNGGDLGFFKKGDMVEPFNRVAFSLEPNQISDVVETEFGFHIIQLLDVQPARTRSLDEVREEIVRKLTDRRRDEQLRAYIEQLKSEADIRYPSGS